MHKTMHAPRSVWLAGLAALACAQGPTSSGEESVRTNEAALSPAEASTLSFEDADQWQVAVGPATLALGHLTSEGQHSLAVSNFGYVQVRQTLPLVKDGPSPNVVGYDVRIPAQQVNPYWLGSTELYISAPSVGIWNQYLGFRSLQDFPKERFQRVEYVLPDWIQAALQGNYTDLTFTIVLNATQGNGTYYLDHLTASFETKRRSPTIDDLTSDADCDAEPSTCCPLGGTLLTLTPSADTFHSTQGNVCIVASGGGDSVYLEGSGASSVNLGPGDDTVIGGPGNDMVWAGPGNDTLHVGGGGDLVFGNEGNDTILATNGTIHVVPGPGVDTVRLAGGDDTVYIYDLCEVGAGENLDGGAGADTLVTPVSVAELQGLGVNVANFERIVVQRGSCRSQCVQGTECEGGEGPLTPEVYAKNPPRPPLTSAADFPAFRDWYYKMRSEDLPEAQRAISLVLRSNSIANAVIAEFQEKRAADQIGPSLMMLALLGELRSSNGAAFLTNLVHETLPPATAGGGWTPRAVVLAYQKKAVHGLAWMRTADTKTTLLQLVSQHEELGIRAEAVRAALFGTYIARSEVAGHVRSGEEFLLDRFERRNLGGTTFEQKMATYLAQHPLAD